MSSIRFNPDKDIPDLTGKVILVTGGNVGLGKEAILQLCKHNPAQIYLGARSEAKARQAISDITKSVPNAAPIEFVDLDLASFASVKRAAATLQSQTKELHILMNNAGIMATPAGLTKEGYELQFGTNHMGHALLTRLLLPTLLETARSGKDRDVRIINLSSAAEAWGPREGYDFAGLKTDMAGISTWARYGTSKTANIHFTRVLARLYPEIRCISLHPGSVNTNLSQGLKDSWPFLAPFLGIIGRLVATPVQNGAKNQLWASVSPDARSGEFYFPVGVTGKGTPLSGDDKMAQKLWDWTEKELDAHA